MKKFLAGCDSKDLEIWVKEHNFPSYRSKQILQWIYGKQVINPDLMANIPLDLRQKLKDDYFAPSSEIIDRVDSGADVVKLGITLHDGEIIEAAIIPADERITFCLSVQAGCPVKCRFCASGINGLARNLTAGEILEEFLLCCGEIGGKCDNIVFMGIGESMLNVKELLKVLDKLVSPDGYAMSPRRITVSTSGIVPGMLEYAKSEKREFNLAISLHAPDDTTRAKLIPDALRFPIAEILNAADKIKEVSGRQYTLEYTMVAGVNDFPEQAEALADIARKHRAKINLIPCNAATGVFRRPSRIAIEKFEEVLTKKGARFTRRMERGSSGSAACGQLRVAHKEKGK